MFNTDICFNKMQQGMCMPPLKVAVKMTFMSLKNVESRLVQLRATSEIDPTNGIV